MPRSARSSSAGANENATVKPVFPVLKPTGQIDFYARLQAVRKRYLQEALRQTIEVPERHLKRLASFGLCGEIFFPMPYLLTRNPYLLGYYRLLYGFSCKAFYEQGPFKRFQKLENSGRLDGTLTDEIPALCRSLCATGGILLELIEPISLPVVNELQILTLGAQFRGSGNVKFGKDATDNFFNLIKLLLAAYNPTVKGRTISFLNDSRVAVTVHFGSDTDVSVTQNLGSEQRKLLAIEIKGGSDVSNIWNRLGEAEKSHAKANALGFNELWTITRVDLTTDLGLLKKARAQSKSTTRFFFLEKIADATAPEAMAFRQVFGSIMGVRLTP